MLSSYLPRCRRGLTALRDEVADTWITIAGVQRIVDGFTDVDGEVESSATLTGTHNQRVFSRFDISVFACAAENVAAAFQTAVGDVMVDRAGNAIAMAQETYPDLASLVIAGGVAANSHLRQRLDTLCQDRGLTLVAPPVELCTDNGAMIAWAGVEHLAAGRSDPLDTLARARWPLDPDAKPMPFAGKKA